MRFNRTLNGIEIEKQEAYADYPDCFNRTLNGIEIIL